MAFHFVFLKTHDNVIQIKSESRSRIFICIKFQVQSDLLHNHIKNILYTNSVWLNRWVTHYLYKRLLVSAKNLKAFSKILFPRTADIQDVYMPQYIGKTTK